MPGFRATMLDYFNQLWRLGRDLHRGFALDLGLDPDFFESSTGPMPRCVCCIIRPAKNRSPADSSAPVFIPTMAMSRCWRRTPSAD
jgi:isopenicillin N synthase-like dioxygenase